MKLNSLYVDDYKSLKEFSISFNRDISILIGINGSGKSSILEAVAQILSDAFLKEKSKFGFALRYDLKFEQLLDETSTTADFKIEYVSVEISSTSNGEDLQYSIQVGDRHFTTIDEIEREFGSVQRILPSNIVIYYSGLSEIMKEICEPHDKLLSKNYRDGVKAPARPFFYFEPPLFDIILIALLSYEYGDIPTFLQDIAKITDIENVRFRLHKPAWARQKVDTWWGAKGEVKAFLDFLDFQTKNGGSKTKTLDKSRVELESGNDDYLIVRIFGQAKLFEIREHLIEEKTLFKILNTLYIDGLWDAAKFSFLKHEEEGPRQFSSLSEGEQQAITIKGLMELVTSENTLFLFDEPDTFLHPSWQRIFIDTLTQFTERNDSIESQFLVTTHSPQLLSNADPAKSEVQIMEDGQVIEITPKYYGKDISQILYEMMGVEGRNRKVAKDISSLFRAIEDEKLEEAKEQFKRLSETLGENDPAIIRAKTQLDYLHESTK